MDTDEQERLVRFTYIAQWLTLAMPPLIFVSFFFLLFIRSKVQHRELRTHLNWQLATYGMIAAMVPAAFLLLAIGLSGVNTDSPISIVATFVLVGFTSMFLPWAIYRLIYGTARFVKQVPMERMLP